MVRESRHLWVGNLPENVGKDRVQDYFNRYGPVQSVRVLPRREERDGSSSTSVTVAFIDITSALKARQSEHKFDERVLETDFYNPDSSVAVQGSSTLTHTEEKQTVTQGGGINTLEQRSSQAYLRGPGPTPHKFRGGGYHDDYRTRPRHQYRTPNFNQDTRNGVVGVGSYRSNYAWKERVGRTDQYNSDKLDRTKPVNGHSGILDHPQPIISTHRTKKKRRKSRSSDSGSNSSGSGSGSRSSSSSSSRSSSSGSNSSKSRSPSRASVTSKIKSSLGNYLPHTEFDKQCTIIVRNLPHRIEDVKLKDELHHEYKRGGCSVRAVRIKTLASSLRVAIITFSDPADVSKALEDSRNKRIFGSLIEAEKLNSHQDERPRDSELSEFHPKATRTLHVGNISREVIPNQINERFKEFGEILEIDIKKPDYALVQFVDIKSVVRAIRAVDGELIAGQRVRLAFGPSVATKCVWCDGVGSEVTEKMLQQEFAQFGKIQDLIVDRSRGHALVYLDQLKKATIAVTEMRGRTLLNSRLQTDYASHECRAAFFDHCKKSGMDVRERAKPWDQEHLPNSERRDGDSRDRLGRERSIDSRGSDVPRGSTRREERGDRTHRKGRDEYDEELRKFQSERGKFDDSDRCFTPPHRRAPPPVSRSPSPPSRLARSPGAHSRSSGYEIRNDGRTFSDRDSVVSDGSRHGSPARDTYRVGRYKPRTTAISPPPIDSRHSSPAHLDDYDRRRRSYRPLEGGESSDYRSSRLGSGDRVKDRDRPTDPRVIEQDIDKKSAYKLVGVDSGLSEDTSSGSSGSVPDLDNAKLLARVSAPPRRVSTDSAVSRSSQPGPDSRPPTPSHIPVYAGASSLLRVMSTTPQELESEAGFGAPRTPSSPPPDSDGSRPGTPLCDENPENLMCRQSAGPVRLSSHLRTSSTSEPMSLPLPMFAQDVLSTSPGDRRSSTERLLRPNQISPRESTHSVLKQGRPDLVKLSIVSPTKFGSPSLGSRDPRLKSPSLKSPSLPISSPAGGLMKLRISPTVPAVPKTHSNLACASPDLATGSLMVKINTHVETKPKDPRLMTGLLAVAVPSAMSCPSPVSPSPKSFPRVPLKPEESKVPAKDLDERMKSFNEQYEKWSGSVKIAGPGSGRADASGRFNIDLRPNQPSAIVQKLLSRKSVLDDDSKRLENLTAEKVEGPAEEKSENSPGQSFGVSGFKPRDLMVRKPSGDSINSLDSPLLPLSTPVTPFSTIPPLPRENPLIPIVSSVMSPVQCQASVRVSAPTKPQPSPLPSRSPAPQSPSTPISPRSLSLSSRIYYPTPSIPIPGQVKGLDLPIRPTEDFSSNKQLTSRPLPLPNKAGTAATSATVPIKPLVDKLGKPAAFTKPSATVTPTLKSTGTTTSTARPSLSTTASTKTVSTCTMVSSAKPPSHIIIPSVEKGEASSTTCSPKLDTTIPASQTETVSVVLETDSDPNVTSTTKDPSIDAKKKLDSAISRDPIKMIKRELDGFSHRDKKDLKEELLFAPTLIQTKPKIEKLIKKFDILDTIGKDGKKYKDLCSTLSKDKLKSNKDSQKHKQKLKHKNDLKDFLSATATIRKETSKKEEKKPHEKEESKKVEESKEKKRRLSSNSEIEDAEQPKSKQAKLISESENEPDFKKQRSDSSNKLSMGRIPKLEKSERSEHRSDQKKDEIKSKHRHSSTSMSSKSKSRHESDKHRHKDKKESKDKEGDKDKSKKKKSSKNDEERIRKHEKSNSLSLSTDDEKMKREKELKRKDSDKERRKDRKDSDRDKDRKEREHKKDSKDKFRDKDRDRDKEKERSKDKEKERERKERKRKKEEEEEKRKMEHVKRMKRLENDSSTDGSGTSDDSKPKFSIFDEPVFDPNNPIYFSMYDKVKARRSCVKAREEEEARKQQEALEKFSKLKAQRAKISEKTNLASSDDSMSDCGKKMLNIYSENESDPTHNMKKKSSALIVSSSENDEDEFKQERRRKKKTSSSSEKKKSFSKKSVMDSSEDSDDDLMDSIKTKISNGFQRSKPSSAIYSSDDDSPIKSHKKAKNNIYSDSESNTESKNETMAKKSIKPISRDDMKISSRISDTESEPGEPKAIALAVLAKSKRKSPVKDLMEMKMTTKPLIKLERLSSESETERKPSLGSDLNIKHEIKSEIKTEPFFNVKSEHDKTAKKKSFKKEKKRDKDSKEKDKSVLGQKMAKIFGTSSEDESFGRNSKPPTPNTSLSKQVPPSSKPVVPQLSVDKVFSAVDKNKMLNSPALMSDSDDDVHSRPPTPTFQTKKVEDTKSNLAGIIQPTVENLPNSLSTNKSQDSKPKEAASRNLFDSSEDECIQIGTEVGIKMDLERSRRLSSHERQKQVENLFDSLLTVNVDLPAKMSRKSPGGLKSPASAKSPGIKSGKLTEPQKSPGSHRSPLLSPGGKPTYLLAHTFNKMANKEAEKRHKEQETKTNRLKVVEKKEVPKPRVESLASGSSLKPILKNTGDEPAVLAKSPGVEVGEEKVKSKPTIESVKSESNDCQILSQEVDKSSSSSLEPKSTSEMKYEVKRPSENKTKVSTENNSSLSEYDEKVVSGCASPQKKDKSRNTSDELMMFNSSAESGYNIFAQGNLDAASSPSPASDYEEGRLVIGDGDDNSDNDVVQVEPTKLSREDSHEDDPEIIEEHINTSHGSINLENKIPKTQEPSREEQLEKSIASITSEMETSDTSINVEPAPATEVAEVKQFEVAQENPVVEVEPPVKRTVISQEETESAVNALLGESFDSFDTEEQALNQVENVEVEQSAGVPVDDEAAAAVAGLGMEMTPDEQIPANISPQRTWTRVETSKTEQQTEPPAALLIPAEPSPPEEKPLLSPVKPIIQDVPVEEKTEIVETKPEEEVSIPEEQTYRGRGRGRGAQKRGRGAATLTTPTTPLSRGRGRGARSVRGQISPVADIIEPIVEPETVESTSTPRGRGRGRVARGVGRGLKRFSTALMSDDKSHDVFEFQDEDEELGKVQEPVKPVVTQSIEKKEEEVEPEVVRPGPGRGRGRGGRVSVAPQQISPKPVSAPTPTPVTTPISISIAQSSPAVHAQPLIQTMSPMQSSPTVSTRLSTEEKLSPSLSPGAGKTVRMRRSTGGKSRESEEESADTDHKIKLILEQAKQEAAQQAAAVLVSMPGFAFQGGIPITAVTTQAALLSPQSALQAAAPPPVQDPRSSVMSFSNIRTGIPQPTVLPPRHDQLVRPPVMVPPARSPAVVPAVIQTPRAPLPIQLPTQPLPPESVRKTQPVLLEQNPSSPAVPQVGSIPRTTISVSLPTEPVPRSVAMSTGSPVSTNIPRMSLASIVTSMSRMPLTNPGSNMPRMPSSSSIMSMTRMPASSSILVNARAPAPMVVSSQLNMVRHPGPQVSRPMVSVTRTTPSIEGQRVSLKQREGTKDPELDQKLALEALLSQHAPLKREYLQPREQDGLRPSSTPLSSHSEPQHPKEDDKQAYSAQHQQFNAQTLELLKFQNYRDLTILYNQLVNAGHPQPVAIQYAQTLLRERIMEDSRPGSVPPMPHLHHIEEERREPVRQPLPAHSSGPYRQTDSPIFHHLPPAHTGSQHPYLARDTVGPPSAHMDPYRREELVPPAAHSSQITRLTHSSAVTDFSTKALSPALLQPQPPPSMYTDSTALTNYRMPHLAAYPICWSGILGLKNDMANVQMHYVSGCRDLASAYLPNHGSTLKIVQRMRLEDAQIDGVKKKMDTKSEHCLLLALPHGTDQDQIEKQSKILRNNFITYLQLKSAAGIVNVVNNENQPAIVHVFPSCDFANENLARIAPNLLHRVADIEHLVIVIATVFNDVNK